MDQRKKIANSTIESDVSFCGKHILHNAYKVAMRGLVAKLLYGDDIITSDSDFTAAVVSNGSPLNTGRSWVFSNNEIQTTIPQELLFNGAMSIWVKPYYSSNYRGIYGNHVEPPRSGYAMQFDGNRLYAFGGNGSSWMGIQVPYSRYKRTHYLISMEDHVMTVFANGELVGSRDLGQLLPCNNNHNLILGRSHMFSNRFHYGETSNVKIFEEPKYEEDAKLLFEEGYCPWKPIDGPTFEDDYSNIVAGARSGVRVVGLYESGSKKNLLEGKPPLYTTSSHGYAYRSWAGFSVGYNYMGGYRWFINNGVDIFGLVGGEIVFENGIVGKIFNPSNGWDRTHESAYIYYIAYSDMPNVFEQ
jgi:hypothetical protein